MKMPHSKYVEAQVILDKFNLKVLRINIKAGAGLPEHSAKEEVLITVIKGNGTFTVDSKIRNIHQGGIINLEPNKIHAVTAKEDLELIVVKIKTYT